MPFRILPGKGTSNVDAAGHEHMALPGAEITVDAPTPKPTALPIAFRPLARRMRIASDEDAEGPSVGTIATWALIGVGILLLGTQR
jgi:hypothetical protein